MSDIPTLRTRGSIRTSALIKHMRSSLLTPFYYIRTLFVYGHSPYRAVRSHNTGFSDMRSCLQVFRRPRGEGRCRTRGDITSIGILRVYVYTCNISYYVCYVYMRTSISDKVISYSIHRIHMADM